MGQYSFQEVMRQWGRLCSWHCNRNADDCEGCILGETHADACASYAKDNAADRETIERIVMEWAAEHPEPVYETWLEFIKRFETGEPKSDNDFVYWLGTTRIPADIAEKLGIQPKEG